MEYYKTHRAEMNLNRLVHYYRQKLGKEYVDGLVKAKGKAEACKTFKVVTKLRKKLSINETERQQLELLHKSLEPK